MERKLVDSPFFNGFDEETIAEILNTAHYNIIRYNKNSIVFRNGDLVKSLYIISKGSVRTEMLDSSGNIFRMEDIYINQVIGPGFLYGDSNLFPVNVVANNDTSIIVIPKESFEFILAKYPKLMVNYLNIISNKTQFLALRIKNVFLQSIEGKIAHFFLKKSKETNSLEFEIEGSQIWLAERFNVARPSVARVISKMKTKGIIDTKGRKVQILNKALLKKCVSY